MLTLKPIKGGGKVEPIVNKDCERRGTVFYHPFSNTWLSARKMSGKTSLIFHILKKMMDKNSVIVIFCPTYDKDPAYKTIRDHIEKKGNKLFTYYGLNDPIDMNNPKSPRALSEWLAFMLKQPRIDEDESSEDELEEIDKRAAFLLGKAIDKKKKKPPRPNYIFIIDDCGSESRSIELANLFKINRHYGLNNIVSSQYITDLDPQTIAQCNNIFLSKGSNEEKLEHLFSKIEQPITFDEFKRIYDYATEPDYSFLRIDVNNGKYYRTFEGEILPSSD